MKGIMKKSKIKPREYYIVESEYGFDFKRYIRSIHPTKEEAVTLKKHLDIKNPHDKHEVILFREVTKNKR